MGHQGYDVIVAGLGGSGSAILYHLASRGCRILGLERFDIVHDKGSSHGLSRVIRLAYHLGEGYVPLLKRSYELWREIEERSGEKLLTITGSIDISPAGRWTLTNSLNSARRYDLPHRLLDAEQVMSSYPALVLAPDMKAVFEPDGGFLEPEKCIAAYVNQAVRLGAEVRVREEIKSWVARGDGVHVVTDRATYTAKRLVVSAGAWVGKLLNDIRISFTVTRQVVGWFSPKDPAMFKLGKLPVWMLHAETPEAVDAYGIPIFDAAGFKIGVNSTEVADPETVNRETGTEDEQRLRNFMRRYLPAADGPLLAMKACLYTVTPDKHFVLDFHPDHPQVVIASCCSGHGFKFCSVIGEIAANLCIDGKTSHDIKMFSAKRFQRQS